MRLLNLAEAALAIGVSPRSLADPRYRSRIGIRVYKVGRRTLFDEADLQQLLERSRERSSSVDGQPDKLPTGATQRARSDATEPGP